ncbi:MAG: hypothetical protein WD270_02630 [Acetobacterales bacterium]
MLEKFAPNTGVDELSCLLEKLGHKWANSAHRPRPSADTLKEWDEFIDRWVDSDLPLLFRDIRRRGDLTVATCGRRLLFTDNSPASWAFHQALLGHIPDLSAWDSDNLTKYVPISFVGGGSISKRHINKAGWKVCHIESVSDRKRVKVEEAEYDWLLQRFRRFMSPRNMFLVPKVISGVGEIPAVLDAVARFEGAKG